MGWAEARSQIAAVLDGAAITSPYAETLRALEYPARARQGASALPLAFVIPPARRISRGPNGMRRIQIDEVKIRVLLHDNNAEDAAQRMDAWVARMIDIIGDNMTLNGTVQVVAGQEFTEFSTFGPDGGPPYGFDMTLSFGANGIVETETRNP